MRKARPDLRIDLGRRHAAQVNADALELDVQSVQLLRHGAAPLDRGIQVYEHQHRRREFAAVRLPGSDR